MNRIGADEENSVGGALEMAARDVGLGMVSSVPDFGELVAEETTEPTEDEVPVEAVRARPRLRAEVSRTLFVEGMRSVRVNAADKKDLCVEIVEGDGQQILGVSYLARGGSRSVHEHEIARLSIDGDLVGCIPPNRAATLWRAGQGASQVRLHGGPRGCVQKLSPGEVLEIRESDTERWLIRQIPVEFAHEPDQAEALPVATIQDGQFWEDGTATELTH